MKARLVLFAGATVLCAGLLGCGQGSTPVNTPAHPPVSVVTPSDPAFTASEEAKGHPVQGSGEVVFGEGSKRTMSVPATWKQEEPNGAMSLAQFKIPHQGSDKEDGLLTVFQMATGNPDANISRWAGQFGGDKALLGKQTIKTAAGDSAIVVELAGEFSAGSMGGSSQPKSDYKMLGAIIPVGGSDFYFKLTGPHATIDAAKVDFNHVVETLK